MAPSDHQIPDDRDTVTICCASVPIDAPQVSLVIQGFARKVVSATPSRVVGLQENTIDVWYEAYPHSPTTSTITVAVFESGQPFPAVRIGEHVATVITPARAVWHVYADARENEHL